VTREFRRRGSNFLAGLPFLDSMGRYEEKQKKCNTGKHIRERGFGEERGGGHQAGFSNSKSMSLRRQ